MAYRWIDIKDAKREKIYSHYEYINSEGQKVMCYSTIIYKGDGKGITFWMLHDDPDEVYNKEPDIENIIRVREELIGKESDEYNKSKFDISTHMANLLGLYNDCYYAEGEHELDNTWTSYDFYEIAEALDGKDFYIWGVAPAPYSGCLGGKPTCFVLEDHLTGNRWWVHTKDEWVEKMRNQMAWAYNSLYGVDKWEVTSANEAD